MGQYCCHSKSWSKIIFSQKNKKAGIFQCQLFLWNNLMKIFIDKEYMKNEAKDIIENCESELIFKTSRSSGSGGQHVNKVETKVTLRWKVSKSEHLSEEEQTLILSKLSTYATKEGEIIIHSESGRSQLKNKEKAIAKWKKAVEKAFIKKKKRKPTKISKAAKAKIRKAKEKKSSIKKDRKKPKLDD